MDFLAEAKKALAEYKRTKEEVDLRQACDKGFGAFGQALMHYRGRELHRSEFGETAEELTLKTGNRDISRALRDAEALRASFYHLTLSLSEVEDALEEIERGIKAITELK